MLRHRTKRIICSFLSGVMLFCNLASGMTAYAVGPDSPVNPDGTKPNGNKPQDTAYVESTYVNDTPIRLQVSKVKTAVGDHEGIAPNNTDVKQEDTITYKISGRIEGTAAELSGTYGADNIELAYGNNGNYLGYGWFKGTLEYLINRKAENLNEEVQIIYNEYGTFDGYGYITRKLETADDVNRYVAGSTMALYDAVEIFRNPEVTNDGDDYREDDRFTGVKVIRDQGSNNVTSVYVEKGYAGTQVEYVLQKDDESLIEIDANGRIINDNYNYQDEINDKGEGVWIAKTIQREDTPILFYSLDNLQITTNDTYVSVDSQNDDMIDDVFGSERLYGHLYGFDKDGNVVDISQRDEIDFSVYAFEAGTSKPVYEFVGGDYNEIRYSMPEKRIIVGKDTIMYHLDENGNRDAMVDPQTGIAYIEEKITPPEGHDNIHDVNDTESTKDTKIFVWPVNVFYDGSGADSGNANGSKSFSKIITTRIATINADTENEYTTGTLNGDQFEKVMNPVLDQYGHPIYYRQSDETYVKGEDTWDYDGDEYTGYVYTDRLDTENENSYSVNDHDKLYNGDKDDPFDQSTHYQYSKEQSIKITIDTDGNYIVNGKNVVPVPVRDGYVFGGWLMEPNDLTDGCVLNAWWRNENNSMSEDERQQWYSDRTAQGNTKTITVKFNANGGEFRSGSGDIHSTDNILYRRLGDAYIMENVWTTGENTPNDPFDTQLIDTVKNTAENKNTRSGQNQTGNDVYSNTNAGGQADMLKRVNVGTYIMEEIEPAAGYVKALPVGVTVNENTEIQYTEMTDVTVKAEFVKTDSPVTYTNDLYIDGNLSTEPSGTHITVNEPKGSYSFTHVKGAVLSLKANDDETRKAFSDWVKVTVCDDFTKKQDGNNYYIEFSTDIPLYLEALPAGNYILSEVVTPPGFVTMDDQEITITPEGGVHFFEMSDDHTKVEIEKYYLDGNTKYHLPNAYRAELSLVDADGNTVDTWKTDDLSDYTNDSAQTGSKSVFEKIADFFRGDDTDNSFVNTFTERIRNGETDFDAITWTVTREAKLSSASTEDNEIWIISDGSRYTCNLDTPEDGASQAFKDAYYTRNQEEKSFTYTEEMRADKNDAETRNLSDQIWDVSNGTKIHISVYPAAGLSSSNRQEYAVDFKFNYKNDYEGNYVNTVSYDTLDGMHRFDYLPEGTYTLKETDAPDGYIAAADKTFTVNAISDVQRFTLENKKRQLEIGKKAKIGDLWFAGMNNDAVITTENENEAAVMAGAELTLYYSKTQVPDYKEAFSNGKVPDGVAQADKWVSGTDGKYTQSEYNSELITKDKIGDYKPHVIEDVENGWYYLVETSTPDYYKTMPVQEIKVTDDTTADVFADVEAINTPVPLEVKVFKKNNEGSPLSGAVFEVTNKTLGGTSVGTFSTGSDGYGKIILTETGRFGKDGAFEPYTFAIREVSAPAGYSINEEIHEFTMSPDDHDDIAIMLNPSDSDIVDGVLYVNDEDSVITISKSDFGTGEAVPGTKLSVYEAEFDGDKWTSTGIQKNTDWTWTIKGNEKTHSVTGLEGGKSYILVEEEVPEGYTKADDVFFHVAPNATTIDKIWYDPEENTYIAFESDSTGAVESVTFTTRTVMGTYVTITDTQTDDTTNMGTLTGGYVNLSNKEVTEGRNYRMTEYVRYSDGTEDALSTTTFIARLTDNIMHVDLGRDIKDLTMGIEDTDGNSVIEFKPDRTGTYTILNPLKTDPDGLTVTGSLLHKNGINHEAVQSGDQIRYLISYEGEGKEIVITPADGLNYIRLEDFELQSDGNYHYVTKKASGDITIVATVTEDAYAYIDQRVSIDNKAYSYVNPVAVNHGEGVFEKSSKLVISSAVAGTHPENNNAAFTFKIKLTKANGTPLDGGYDYRTRYTDGILRAFGSTSEFEITVNGNDFIIIQDLPYNTRYSVVQVVPEDYDFTVTNTEPSGETSETEVSNVLFTNTRNATDEREIFEKNTGYILSEKLNFTDESDPLELNKYSFSFGEKCEIKDVGMLNKPTEVWFTKTDWTNTNELPGATCVLMDEDGNVLKDELGNELKWVSGEEPMIFKGVLEAGKTYRFHEELAPDGYGYSEDVVFTVSEDGTIDKVIMQDKATGVHFAKVDFGGNEVPGAELSLKVVNDDGSETVIDSWTSDNTHYIEGELSPGKTYIFHEEGAPNGYAYSHDIRFTLDNNGIVINARYTDENGNTLLYDKDGYVTDIALLPDGTYSDGDQTVTINDSGNAVGEDGSVIAEGVKSEIEVINNIIQMKDKPFKVTFIKEDFAGEEVPGATCELIKVNPDGTTEEIDEWVSGDEPHVMEDELEADTTYRYHEEFAPEGYGYSEDIEFTINKDGIITEAHYINEDGEDILYDKDGFPTTIVVHKDGTYTDGDHTITIDENGNAVDENGEIHAEGVQYEIPVEDNVIKMKDAPTQVNLVKVDMNGNPLSNATFAILTKEGVPVRAIKDTLIPSTEHDGNILAGEEIIFLSDGTLTGVNVTGQLIAGNNYILRELTPPDGYIAGDDTTFKMPYLNQKDPIMVTMNNEPTEVTFTKEDFAGKEIPGASVTLEKVNPDGTTEKIDEWVSGNEDHVLNGKLSVDTTYRYHEEFAPEGYGYSEDIEFTINKDGIITEAHYINEDGEDILYDKDGFPTTIVVHEDGTYTDGDHTITIDENGNAVDENGEIHAEGVQYEIPVEDNVIKMKDAPTEVLLVKTDTDGNVLTGGKFQILTKEGVPVRAIKDTLIPSTEHEGNIFAGELLVFAASENGINYTGQLKSGTEYILRELEAPFGHCMSEDVLFRVPYLNQKEPVRVTMEDKPTEVWFTKTDWTETEEVPGAHCVLKDENGNVVIDKDGNRCEWVSGTEAKIFKGSLEPGKTYYYHEELAPDGYGYSEDVVFTVSEDGTIDKVVMKDKPTEVLITKYSVDTLATSSNAAPVDGAKLQILTADGEPVKAIKDSKPDENGNVLFKKGEDLIFTSDKNGTNITGQLNADETYILRELEAPFGHHKSQDVKFTVSHDGSLIKVNMYDPKTVVSILKTDENGTPVSGAKLEVRDAVNYDLIDSFVSSETPHVLTGKLEVGKKYMLVEVEAPSGYYKSEPVTFTVSDNTVTSVAMTDEQIIVKLVKVSAKNDEKLNGGKFSVIRKSDNATVIPEFVLNGEITVTGKLEAGETYLFHEIEAPSGYLKSGDVEFTIPYEKQTDVITVTMENRKPSGGGGDNPPSGGSTSTPPQVTIKKYDGVTMKALPGAEFTFYYPDGKEYKTVTTDANGYAYITFNTIGTYTYKETKAPEGYELNDTVHSVNITKTSYITENIANYEEPPKVIITKKDSETGEVISGVHFEVYNEEGNVVYRGTTDSYGQINFTPDEYGAYAVKETSVPEGYNKSDGYITFTVSASGITGETTFFNTKVSVTPPEPENDNPGKRGKITADYDNGADGFGEGWFDSDGNWHPFSNVSKVDTGDVYPFAILIGIMLCGIAGFVTMKSRGRRREHE